MKVMLDRTITPEDRIENMFDERFCPNLNRVMESAEDQHRLTLYYNAPYLHYYYEFCDIDQKDAMSVIVEIQEKGMELPFITNMYSRDKRTLTLVLSEECGKVLLSLFKTID